MEKVKSGHIVVAVLYDANKQIVADAVLKKLHMMLNSRLWACDRQLLSASILDCSSLCRVRQTSDASRDPSGSWVALNQQL